MLVRCGAVVLASLLLGPVLPDGATAQEGGPIGTPLPRPEADYRFQNTLTSSVAGAPRLRNIFGSPGANVFAQEVVDGRNRTVLQFPEGNGLGLPNVLSVIGRGRYTMAIRMRFDEVTDYRRVVNFKPPAADNDTGLYVYNERILFYDIADSDPPDPVISADQWVLVVLTRATNGVLRGYVDGQQWFAVNDATGLAKVGADDRIRFFRDNDNREESSGAVARIRLWDEPFTADQVARLSAV
jgi:hypothetical protein